MKKINAAQTHQIQVTKLKFTKVKSNESKFLSTQNLI